jgi:two-component system OmpR family sensor kinase
VAGDEDLLFLAVHNLLANAAKFCGSAGAVEVRAFRDPPWVVIEVADAGPGIPMDELNLIWEELGRGRAARGLPGSGLGLAMVRTIVGRHGGNVEVWSEEGRGTMFTLRLHPAASTRTQQLDVTGRL